MRKLLYPLVFAFVLLLAGSAVALGDGTPTNNGTIPANTVWLPVVVGTRSRACPYIPIPLHPDVGAINPYSWEVKPLTIGESGLMIWDTVFTAYKNSQSTNILDTWHSYGEPLTSNYNPILPSGEYCWRARFICYSGKGFADGGKTAGCRSFRIDR